MKHEKAYVVVLGAEAHATASTRVRTERNDALTIMFFHTIDAAPSALQRDARATLGDDEAVVVLDDGRVHAIYAVGLLVGALAYDALRDIAAARILALLDAYLPRPLKFEVALMDAASAEVVQWAGDNQEGDHAATAEALLRAIKSAQERLASF